MSHHGVEADYTSREELAHSLTHGIGMVLAIVGLVSMVVQTVDGGSVWHIVAAGIFGVSLVMLYSASTLYHAIPWPRVKRTFQTLDHVAIYILIAGTYTPFALITLSEVRGWVLFALVWGLAIIGTFFEILSKGRRMKLALVFYLAMGWVVVFFIKPLSEILSMSGLLLLTLGGLFYTVGAVFYAWKKLPYNHAVWHLFVLAGSVSHFFCVFDSVLFE